MRQEALIMMRTAAVTRALVATAMLLGGPPAILLRLGGSPLPQHMPSAEQITAWMSDPLKPRFLAGAVVAAGWMLWLLLGATIVVSFLARIPRAAPRRIEIRLPGPVQALSAALLGAVAVGTTSTGAASAAAAGLHSADTADLLCPQPTTGTGLQERTIGTPHDRPHTSEDTAVKGPKLSDGRQLSPPLAATSNADLQRHSVTRQPPAFMPVRHTSAVHADATTRVVPPPAVGDRSAGAGGTHRPTVRVERGDTLWGIAETRLDDPHRWPEVYRLNKDRYDRHGQMQGGHHIERTWVLLLPDDTRPATQASPTPTRPRSDPPPAPTAPSPSTPSSTATSAVSARETMPSDDGVVPTATASPPTSQPRASDTTTTDPDGITLPGGWMDLGLATAVAAAGALAWRHRRHRYVPRPLSATPRFDDPDLTPMPPTLRRIKAGLRCRPPATPYVDDRPEGGVPADRVRQSDPAVTDGAADDSCQQPSLDDTFAADQAETGGRPLTPAPLTAADPTASTWPVAGLGLIGPGASAAARGFLVACLAADDHNPDTHTRVIMPAATAAGLLGDAAATLPDTPRLAVTTTLDDALTLLDTHTLQRSRLMYHHETADIAALRNAGEGPLPSVVLIADAGRPRDHGRVAALLTQGHRLDIHGVFLGDWPDGTTVAVAADGSTAPADTGTAHLEACNPDLRHLTVLDRTEAAGLIRILAESHAAGRSLTAATSPANPLHTQAPDNSSTSPQKPEIANTLLEASDGDHHEPATHKSHQPDPGPHAAADGADGEPRHASRMTQVYVAVLGDAGILGADPQRRLRPQALELLVYLAANNGSATVDAILDDLLPEAPARRAGHRLHTYVSDLRGVLRHNGGPGEYVTHPRLRYTLNPAAVTVDLWQMQTAITEATTADDPAARTGALRRAVTAYRGPLAHGHDYLWIEPFREAVRRQALDATTALVDALTDQPQEQLAVLGPAIGLHPYAEHLYQAAMRAHHRLGHLAAIRDLRRAAVNAAADLDAEPDDDTLALADQLVIDLQNRGRQTASGSSRESGS
jgi:DNA-binding SARP family transcriptional activator